MAIFSFCGLGARDAALPTRPPKYAAGALAVSATIEPTSTGRTAHDHAEL